MDRRRTRTAIDAQPAPRRVVTRKSPSRKTISTPAKPPGRPKSKSPARERRTTKDAAVTKIKNVVASEIYDFDYQPPKTEPVVVKKRGRPRMSASKEIENIKNTLPKVVLMNISPKKPTVNNQNKSNNLDDSGDQEVASINTAKRLLRQVSKTFTPEPSVNSNLTPTTTEQSHHSNSRSVSRFEESQEYSDQEYESFTKGNKNGDTATPDKDYNRRSIVNLHQEFGGRFGNAALCVGIPAYVFALLYYCNADSCKFRKIDFDELLKLDVFFNFKISLIYLIYSWGVTIISALPVGKIVKIQNDRSGFTEFYFTGFTCAFFTLLAIFVAEYCYKFPIIDIIMQNYYQLLIVSLNYAFIISIWCFIRSKFEQSYLLNPYAKTNNFTVDAFIGREISPKWFQLIDIKLVHYHISIVLALVFNAIFLYRNLVIPEILEGEQLSGKILFLIQNIKFDNISLLTSTLLIVYLLDLMIFEHHLTWSFELQSEGVGVQLLLRYSTFPFILSMISKYTYEHRITNAPMWIIAVVSFVFLLGLIIKRSSNKMKYAYRMYPNAEQFQNIETLPTFQGKRLLVTGWWGRVRQPNYLGDIISHLSFLPLLYYKFALPPLLAILYSVVVLIHRAKRVNDRNANRYNSAWQRYCQQVPYLLVPKIY